MSTVPESDDGRMVVSMRLPRDLVARVDAEARRTVVSRRALVEHFIKWGCDQRERNREASTKADA